MRNNTYYKQLEQITLDNNYTIKQINAATCRQVADLLNCETINLPRLQNMKELLIRGIIDREDESIMQQLRGQALSWFQANFPDFEIERGRDEDKPYVKIWLKGKPNG